MVEIALTDEVFELATRKGLSYQRELFPIEIVEFFPSNENSADLTLIGAGRNGKHYAIKKISDGNGMTPASEIFCYELARHLNIPTPEFDIVTLQKGELAFGSVWEGGQGLRTKFSEQNAIHIIVTPSCFFPFCSDTVP